MGCGTVLRLIAGGLGSIRREVCLMLAAGTSAALGALMGKKYRATRKSMSGGLALLSAAAGASYAIALL